MRWPRNDLKTYKATVSCKPNRNLSWLALSSASTQSQHDIRTGNPQLFLTPSLQTRSMKGAMASFLPPHSLHFSIEKTSLQPIPYAFFYLSHFLPHRDLSERQRIPSVGHTAWPVATQEAFDSRWNVPSFGELSNSVDTMLVLKHYSEA